MIITSQHAITAMRISILQHHAHIDTPHNQLNYSRPQQSQYTYIFGAYIHQLTNHFMTNSQHRTLSPEPATTPSATDSTRLVSASYCMSATCATRQAILVTAVVPEPIFHSSLKPAHPPPLTVATPVNITNFANCLETQPDQTLVSYLINKLTSMQPLT